MTRDSEASVRRAAASALGFSATRESRHAVAALLCDPDWQLRETAAEAVGKSVDIVATKSLLPLLDDTYWQVRVKAIRSLGLLKVNEAVAAIGAALTSGIHRAHPRPALRRSDSGASRIMRRRCHSRATKRTTAEQRVIRSPRH
jgi:hypothetical protein